MKKRVDLLARIEKLATKMHDLGRWRISAIEQEQASLSDDLRAVFEALETGDLAYGPQAKLSTHRIRALQRQLDTLEHESTRLSHAAKQHGIRAKLAGKAAEAADKVYRDREARKELADIVERALMQRDASQR